MYKCGNSFFTAGQLSFRQKEYILRCKFIILSIVCTLILLSTKLISISWIHYENEIFDFTYLSYSIYRAVSLTVLIYYFCRLSFNMHKKHHYEYTMTKTSMRMFFISVLALETIEFLPIFTEFERTGMR